MPTKIETKALEAACEKATDKLEIDWDGDEPFVRSDSIETAVEAAIRAYLAALDSPIGEQGVGVKALTWHPASTDQHKAETFFGWYWIREDAPRYYADGPLGFAGNEGSLSAAKAACQADFTRRILSALSPERKEPVAYARVYDKAKPHYDDIVSPNSQEAEMWAYDLIPLYAGQPT